MPTRDLVCAYCGKVGEIDLGEKKADFSSSLKFKYLGRNPVSGHMHVQCPACGIVTLVSPPAIPGNAMGTEIYHSIKKAFSPDMGVAALSSLIGSLN
ncbi:MAG: hypothetical protein JW902_05125 [Syntrophaceae bacterium]|nr:hypothetical protein [Syntrophaceae bacterium]